MFKDNFITVCRAHHLALKSERTYWSAARTDRLYELREADLPHSVEERKELRSEKSRLLEILGLKA